MLQERAEERGREDGDGDGVVLSPSQLFSVHHISGIEYPGGFRIYSDSCPTLPPSLRNIPS